VRAFGLAWIAQLQDSDCGAGCPVVAASLEGDRSPAARDAAGAAFESWTAVLADALEPRVVDRARAETIATMVVAAIEGAVVLARAQRSVSPVERVATELERLIVDAIG
jgi:hypothetical protein